MLGQNTCSFPEVGPVHLWFGKIWGHCASQRKGFKAIHDEIGVDISELYEKSLGTLCYRDVSGWGTKFTTYICCTRWLLVEEKVPGWTPSALYVYGCRPKGPCLECSIGWPLVCQNDLWRKLKAEFAKVIFFWRKFGERSKIWLEHTWIFKKTKFM